MRSGRELNCLIDGQLKLVVILTPGQPEVLTSGVLPLTLRQVPGDDRPTIELARLDGGQTWQL